MVWRYLKGIWDQFRYNNRMKARPAGVFAFWESLSWWWKERPKLRRCLFCGVRIWVNGQIETYCSSSCAYYGPYENTDNDEIPF